MSDILRAPINYGVAADGQFVKGGSVAFGFENIRPDEANPATLKAIFLDDGLTLQATNPQGLSSDATFNQADNGVLFGETGAKYSIIIYDANDQELSYIPSYDLSDASASITAQDAANDASASAVAAALSEVAAGLSEANTLALYTDFVNRYFGPFASDPAVDDEGNPPVDGSLYWNTVNKTFKAYDSGVWYLPQDLGFGTAAYANVQTSPGDTTANALMVVGAFGNGLDGNPSVALTTAEQWQKPSGSLAVLSGNLTTGLPETETSYAVWGPNSSTTNGYTVELTVRDSGNKYTISKPSGGIPSPSEWQPVYTGAIYQPSVNGVGFNVVRQLVVNTTQVPADTTTPASNLSFFRSDLSGNVDIQGAVSAGIWRNVNGTTLSANQVGDFVRES